MKDTRNLKFLVVDDSLHIRKIIKAVCQSIGVHDVVEASDGRVALEELKTNRRGRGKIDLIICDWAMPELTGLELLRAVRADSSLRKTPFLMVTAEHDQAHVLQAVKEGVDDYVIKPFTADTLTEKIERILAVGRTEVRTSD